MSKKIEPIVISRKATHCDMREQDHIINEMELQGYRHYETLPIGGNEIILRFRKVQ